MGLILLGKLRNLKRLKLLLRGPRLAVDEAKGLVYSLYSIPTVQLIVESAQQRQCFTTTLKQAKAAGIAAPEGFEVKVNEDD